MSESKQLSDITKCLMVVCNPDHPHFGCTGYLTGKIIRVIDKPMAELKADNCKHLGDAFFVSKGDVKTL